MAIDQAKSDFLEACQEADEEHSPLMHAILFAAEILKHQLEKESNPNHFISCQFSGLKGILVYFENKEAIQKFVAEDFDAMQKVKNMSLD